MSNLTIPIMSVCLIVSFLGLLTIWKRIMEIQGEMEFIHDYGDKFSKMIKLYFVSHNIEQDTYFWLTKNVNKIQRLLGANGIIHLYRPAYSTTVYSQYHILVNTLPQFIRSGPHLDDCNSCLEAITKHIGQLEEQDGKLKNRLRNPLMWLQDGFRFIILLPFYIFRWLGLLESPFIRKVATSAFVQLISGLLSAMAILGTIVGLIVDWDNFVQRIQSWFSTFFT